MAAQQKKQWDFRNMDRRIKNHFANKLDSMIPLLFLVALIINLVHAGAVTYQAAHVSGERYTPNLSGVSYWAWMLPGLFMIPMLMWNLLNFQRAGANIPLVAVMVAASMVVTWVIMNTWKADEDMYPEEVSPGFATTVFWSGLAAIVGVSIALVYASGWSKGGLKKWTEHWKTKASTSDWSDDQAPSEKLFTMFAQACAGLAAVSMTPGVIRVFEVGSQGIDPWFVSFTAAGDLLIFVWALMAKAYPAMMFSSVACILKTTMLAKGASDDLESYQNPIISASSYAAVMLTLLGTTHKMDRVQAAAAAAAKVK
jgi:hypothetical protein